MENDIKMKPSNQRSSIFKIAIVFSAISLLVYFISEILRYKFDIGLIFLSWEGFFYSYGICFGSWLIVSVLTLLITINVSTEITPKALLIRIGVYVILGMLSEATIIFVFSKLWGDLVSANFFDDFLRAFSTSVYHASVLTIVFIAMNNKKVANLK